MLKIVIVPGLYDKQNECVTYKIFECNMSLHCNVQYRSSQYVAIVGTDRS